ERVMRVRSSREVRPSTFTVRDVDFRKPRYPLFVSASADPSRSAAPALAAPEVALFASAPVETLGYLPPPLSPAPRAAAPDACEQYHYAPGAFLVETSSAPSTTPVADDKSVARYEEPFGRTVVQNLFESEAVLKKKVSFESNVTGLYPGVVFSIDDYP